MSPDHEPDRSPRALVGRPPQRLLRVLDRLADRIGSVVAPRVGRAVAWMNRHLARTRTLIVTVLVAALLMLAAGFLIKDRCTTRDWDGTQYRTSCYNDIFALYPFRGLDRGLFPYVHGEGEDHGDADGTLEYPVGTGLYIGGIARLVETGQSFFRLNAVGLALAGLLTVGLLLLLVEDRRRVLLFALGPPLGLYAFHNWDLLAVLFMVAALLAFARARDHGAGTLLGVGAATKLFPGLLAPGLLATRARERSGSPWGLVWSAVVAFVLLNLPIYLANPAGWWYPWRFQSSRFPNFETSWYMIFRHGSGGTAAPESFWWVTYPRLTGILSGLLFLAALAWLLRAEWQRPRMRPYAVSFEALLLFLLTAKVYSPQFSLWLLPFFVLVRIPWYGYAAFVLTDAAVWAAVSYFFLGFNGPEHGMRLNLLEFTVWVRYAALGLLLWLSRRSDENVAAPAPPEVASGRAWW